MLAKDAFEDGIGFGVEVVVGFDGVHGLGLRLKDRGLILRDVEAQAGSGMGAVGWD